MCIHNVTTRNKSDINKCLKLQIIRKLDYMLSAGSTWETFGRNEVTSGRGLAMDHRLDA